MTASTDRNEASASAERMADEAVQTATREGKRVAKAAGRRAEGLAEERKAFATDYMRGLSAAVETGCQALEKQGHQQSAEMLDRVAGELRGLASSMERKTPGEMLREIEGFAHRRPALFFGAALLAGFGAARFLKSAQPDVSESNPGGTLKS